MTGMAPVRELLAGLRHSPSYRLYLLLLLLLLLHSQALLRDAAGSRQHGVACRV